MYAAFIALVVWTGPHSACVWSRPYDGEPAVSAVAGEKQRVDLMVEGGLLERGPDRQSATVCAQRMGKRAA
jgi:hypothetical protein